MCKSLTTVNYSFKYHTKAEAGDHLGAAMWLGWQWWWCEGGVTTGRVGDQRSEISGGSRATSRRALRSRTEHWPLPSKWHLRRDLGRDLLAGSG